MQLRSNWTAAEKCGVYNITKPQRLKCTLFGHLFSLKKNCIQLLHSLVAQAYHITNDEPIYFWTFMTRIVQGLGYDAPHIYLPYLLVYFIAFLLMVVSKLLSPLTTLNPTLTPMKVALAGTHHFYLCDRAKRDMGYKPIVSLDEGIERTVTFFGYLKSGADGDK